MGLCPISREICGSAFDVEDGRLTLSTAVAAFAEELDGFSGLRDEVVRLRETAKRSSKLSDLFTQDPSRHRELQVRTNGDYNAWPGPNSNTFVQAVLDAVPELKTVLPPTAIGKDYPYRGEWFGLTPSGTGAYASLGGYLGLTIGWVEGLEVNFLGAVLGLDIRRPALKLPGIGRLGMTAGI